MSALATIVDDIPIIDSDTHVIEPADLWTSRLSLDRWGTLVPHVRWDDETAEEVWYFGDKKIYAAGLACGARWHEYPPDHPRRLSDADVRCYDAQRRLEHMDEYGVIAQVLYPNIGVFQVNEYIGMKADPQLVLECVQAYNDFLVDFGRVAPERYVPLMTVPFWNLDAAITELHRSHATGHKGVVFPARMEDFNLPPLSHAHWDPFWSEVQDMDLSINFHIGSGNIPMFGTDNSGKHLNYAWTGSMLFFLNANAITSLIFGGVCQRFPRLKFVSVESGVGWVPFLLEGMDWQFHNAGAHLEHPELELLPSEYFARQIYSCFWFERASARAAIEQLGADHVMFETDFPHSTGITPGPASAAMAPRDHLRVALAGMPDESIRKVLHDNAAALYHLTV
jgi:predicted TIM-barrel fold metal-dependent hydrolase